MTVPDDSALCHSGVYNPAKAREYYLRTRQLKGRSAGVGDSSSPRTGGHSPVLGSKGGGDGGSKGMRPSRRAELLAQKAALTKRLERLKDVLAELVSAAKKRSGIPEPDENQTPTEQAKEKAAQNENAKGKPLTAKQKREKREASKKQYEKEKGMGLSKEVQELQDQMKEIRAKIEDAIKDARKKHARSKPPDGIERPLTLN